jgi:hypothetical protein
MRYRLSEMFDVEKAVEGATSHIKKHRMRHSRSRIFARRMIGV